MKYGEEAGVIGRRKSEVVHVHTPPEDHEQMILRTLKDVLRNVADSFVGLVAHDVVTRVFQREYISAAHRRLLSDHACKATQSQIGILTGIGPEAVREALNRPANRQSVPLSVEARILKLWAEDPEYRDPGSGKPARLLIFGKRDTFQGLINRVVRGITPQDAIRTLSGNGNVEIVDKNWVTLNDPKWVPGYQEPLAGAHAPRPDCPPLNDTAGYEN